MPDVYEIPIATNLRQAITRLLLRSDAFGSVLLVALVDAWGLDEEAGQACVFEWAPETILHTIRADFGVPCPRLNFDKLLAAIAILTTDGFFNDLYRFTTIVNALVGNGFDPTQEAYPDVAECAWAMTEGILLYPPTEKETFNADIRAYLGMSLKNEGFTSAPDELQMATGDYAATVDYSDIVGDDPAMTSAMLQFQSSKTDEVTQMIKDNLLDLQSQMHSLPLQIGKSADFMSRVRLR